MRAARKLQPVYQKIKDALKESEVIVPDEIPATNHLAEQALRTPIANRKVFGGNRTDPGCRAQEIHSSTIQTCQQQKRSAIAFIRDSLCGMAQSIFNAVDGRIL